MPDWSQAKLLRRVRAQEHLGLQSVPASSPQHTIWKTMEQSHKLFRWSTGDDRRSSPISLHPPHLRPWRCQGSMRQSWAKAGCAALPSPAQTKQDADWGEVQASSKGHFCKSGILLISQMPSVFSPLSVPLSSQPSWSSPLLWLLAPKTHQLCSSPHKNSCLFYKTLNFNCPARETFS